MASCGLKKEILLFRHQGEGVGVGGCRTLQSGAESNTHQPAPSSDPFEGVAGLLQMADHVQSASSVTGD
ncbi:hypothetical protein ATANTOWER_031725 [Ataeniobius toweri]|uniref:Uncharacterized protein n=1 Tax=Ataeniobius toweri TaxID=208326 RepID=A0ABU7AMT2_9TELE|nr:hypothetical protein [Ataeniobius toweri]